MNHGYHINPRSCEPLFMTMGSRKSREPKVKLIRWFSGESEIQDQGVQSYTSKPPRATDPTQTADCWIPEPLASALPRLTRPGPAIRPLVNTQVPKIDARSSRQIPPKPHPTPKMAAPKTKLKSTFVFLGTAHWPPSRGCSLPRPKWYNSVTRGRAPMARYAREGSNEPSNGRSRNEMTRVGCVRLEKWRAMAKLKPLVMLATRRRIACG